MIFQKAPSDYNEKVDFKGYMGKEEKTENKDYFSSVQHSPIHTTLEQWIQV